MSQNGSQRDKLMQTWAELEWVWVLVNPVTKDRDSILVIEMDLGDEKGQKRIVPIFENREAALALKPRFSFGQNIDYDEQAIRLGEVGKFAATEKLEIMLLDEAGRIIAHLAAQIEESAIH